MSKKTYIQKVMVFLCQNWDALGIVSVAWVESHSIKVDMSSLARPFHVGRLGRDDCEFTTDAAGILGTTEEVVSSMIDGGMSIEEAVSEQCRRPLRSPLARAAHDILTSRSRLKAAMSTVVDELLDMSPREREVIGEAIARIGQREEGATKAALPNTFDLFKDVLDSEPSQHEDES